MKEVSGRWIFAKKIVICPETSLASLSIGARKDLTDRQWRILEPLLPRGKRPGRPPKWTRRQLLDGIRWRTRVGAPWRDVPNATGTGSRSTGCSGAGNAP